MILNNKSAFHSVQHYPDPSNCQNYYDCYNGCIYNRTCPENEYWNPVMNYCDWEWNVDCGVNPGPTPPPNDFVCPEPNGFFGDAKNCIKFYECRNNISNHHTCNTCKLPFSLEKILKS